VQTWSQLGTLHWVVTQREAFSISVHREVIMASNIGGSRKLKVHKFLNIKKPPRNFRGLKGDMKQITYWGPKMLGATVRALVAMATSFPGFVYSWPKWWEITCHVGNSFNFSSYAFTAELYHQVHD